MVKGNKQQNKGLIDLSQSSVSFKAELDDSLTMLAGPLTLKKYSDGTGRLSYKDNNGEGSEIYKSSQEIGLSLDYSGNELYLLHGLTSTNDSIYYSGQGQTVSGGNYSNYNGINYSNSLFNLRGQYSFDGEATLNYNKGSVALKLVSNQPNNLVQFDFSKDAYFVEKVEEYKKVKQEMIDYKG